MREAAESESQINLVSYEDAYEPGFEDMPRRVPDISKVEGAIGWRPTRDLAGILDDVIQSERQAGIEASIAEIA